MKVLNILLGGGVGGIETLCKDIAKKATFENGFYFILSEGTIYEEMKNEGVTVYSFDKYLNPKVSLQRILALRECAKNYDLIVVHHNSLLTHCYYSVLKLLLPRKKYIFMAHSCFEEKEYYNHKTWVKRFSRKMFLKIALGVSNKVIFVSNAGKKSYLENFRILEDKVDVVYNGIDVEKLKKKKIYNNCNVKKDFYRITYIGRLVEVKGVHLLIEAVSQLVNEGYSLYVEIIGDGEWRSILEQKVKEYQLENNIKFEGVQRDISKFLEKTDIFVYPSICEEVFGISIVEAMAYEIPCIVNQVGGIPEIVVDQYNGFITESKTGKSIAEAIKKIINLYESEKIDIIRKNCRNTALNFDINKTIQNLSSCYGQLLKDDKEH